MIAQNGNRTGDDQSTNSYLAMVGDVHAELTRLQVQHRWIQMCLKDKIAFAPVDLTKEELKILDMGCADGTLLRDLQKQVPASAQMVGADVSTAFLPASAQGNIRYVTQDVCDPPAAALRGQFDMTHVRNVLHSTQKSGIEQAVANLSGMCSSNVWSLAFAWCNMYRYTGSGRLATDHGNGCDPGQPKQPQALQDLIQIIGYMFEKQGLDRHYARKIPGSMKKAGLENVTVETVECGIGKVLGDDAAVRSSIEPFMHTIPLVARNANG
ncbi:methyltransferase domain-containing protein [Colletotrichum tofieldiae]|nr:methyltransferase domain-containing protein [Colletotrichum tofieldiae]